jgi:hypothetical protein
MRIVSVVSQAIRWTSWLQEYSLICTKSRWSNLRFGNLICAAQRGILIYRTGTNLSMPSISYCHDAPIPSKHPRNQINQMVREKVFFPSILLNTFTRKVPPSFHGTQLAYSSTLYSLTTSRSFPVLYFFFFYTFIPKIFHFGWECQFSGRRGSNPVSEA